MTKKKELSKTEVDRRYQRIMEDAGETWNLELVLSGAGDQVVLASLAGFSKRSDLKPATERKVIEAARAVIAELERQGKLGAVTPSPRKRAGKRV
jgi:beta-phosphoglucomutase-like phosphatase (HAD superfamily)